MTHFVIHYHGIHSGNNMELIEYEPIEVFNIINLIGTKWNLEFDFVELRE